MAGGCKPVAEGVIRDRVTVRVAGVLGVDGFEGLSLTMADGKPVSTRMPVVFLSEVIWSTMPQFEITNESTNSAATRSRLDLLEKEIFLLDGILIFARLIRIDSL